jgi:hypothetical protein
MLLKTIRKKYILLDFFLLYPPKFGTIMISVYCSFNSYLIYSSTPDFSGQEMMK